MKVFFNSTFIREKTLKEASINHQIKLEYYKIINEDEIITDEKPKFGISVVKTEYKKNNTKVEDKTIKYLSNDEKQIEKILKTFKENEVTPIEMIDVISDLTKKAILSL